MRFTIHCKRYISMLFAIILILSGMCLDYEQTHSLFSSDFFLNEETQGTLEITTKSHITRGDQLCTGEVMGIRSESRVSKNRTRSEKKESRVHTMVVSVLAVPLEIAQHFLKSYDGYNENISQSLAVIVSYIHNQGSSKG